MPKYLRSIIINATPEDCYDVIWDFANYPDFVEELKKLTILSKTDSEVVIDFSIHVLKDVVYTLKLIGTKPYKVDWIQTKGFFVKNVGSWLLKELSDGRTEATYVADLEFAILVPVSLITMLINVNFPRMLESFKKRIENIYQAKSEMKQP